MRLRDFVFAYAISKFSHDAAHIVETQNYASMLMHYAEIPKGHKMIIFRVDSHWGGTNESPQYVSEKNAQMHALYSSSSIKSQSGTPYILTF